MPRYPTSEHLLSRWLRTHGHVITAQEALGLGISYGAQRRLVACGRLQRLSRAVMADGGAATTSELAVWAALAQAGPGAVASYFTVGRLWGLLDHWPDRPHVTIPLRRRMRVPHVVVHQSKVPPERGFCDGIPVTSASRTLLDLASLSVPSGLLAEALDRALGRHLTAVPKLVDMVERWPSCRCPGGARLLHSLELNGMLAAPEASALERRTARVLDALCERAGLSSPVAEHRVLGERYRLDFAWPALKLAVEVDGYLWHSSPQAMARDLARRNELAGEGWLVLVFTWHQILHEPQQVEAAILAALDQLANRRGEERRFD